MKYLVIFKADMYSEGTNDHIIEADGMETKGNQIVFYRKDFTFKQIVALYKEENVIFAGEYQKGE